MTVAIGIDIGGTTIKAGLVSPDGGVHAPCQRPTPDTIEALMALIVDLVAKLDRAVATLDDQPVVARTVGVASLGIVDEANGLLVHSANKGWSQVPLARLLTDALERPVVLGHDVRSGAVGEAVFGAGSTGECVFIPVGTGISCAQVRDGRAVAGSPFAGEVGQVRIPNPDLHVPADLGCSDADVPATCTVEQAMSSVAIGRRYGALVARCAQTDAGKAAGSAAGAQGHDGAAAKAHDGATALVHDGRMMAGQANDGAAPWSAKDVFMLAHQGDELAAWVVNSAIAGQALLAAQVCATTGVPRVIMGGGISAAGDAYLVPFMRHFADAMGVLPVPEVVVATLGSWAQTIGIGYQALVADGIVSQAIAPGTAAPSVAPAPVAGAAPSAAPSAPMLTEAAR